MATIWHGREWQDYCMMLLSRRYALSNAHTLQRVPDRDRGDLGLEAFSHDGCAFQCYAAEEPLSTRARYEKQRDKLTRDLAKLNKRREDVAALLGNVMIHRYVFMVHTHDSKELIRHGHAQAATVTSWQLPFIDPSFSVVIETDEDYRAERAEIHAIPAPLIGPVEVAPQARAEWAEANTGLHQTARTKLENVIPSAATLDTVLDSLTRKYLEGENSLERLREIQPQLHSRLLAARADKEGLLELEYSGPLAQTRGLMNTIASEFAGELASQNPTLEIELAKTLAWAAVADWLMRCPLRFEESA